MPWYAIDAIDDAIDSSRRFLFPFSLGRWLRLAVIVFFLGTLSSGGGTPNLSGFNDVGGTPQPTPSPQPTPELDPGMLGGVALLIIGLVVVLLLLGLVFGLIGDVMRFVFLDALRTDDVRIRGPFRRRLGKGLRLFGFKLLVNLAVGIPIAAAVSLVVLAFAVPGVLSGYGIDPGIFVGVGGAGFIAIFVLITLVTIVLGLLIGLTNTFVTAVMLVEDVGVIEGWRRFWPTLRGEWKQYLVYLIARAILSIGVGLVTLVVVAIPSLVIVAITAIVLIAIASTFGATLSVPTVALGGLTLLVALLALLVVSLPVGIVIQTYFRMYELIVLGRSNEAFALVPLPDDDDDGDDGENTGDGSDGGDGPSGYDGDTGEFGDERTGDGQLGSGTDDRSDDNRSDDDSPSWESTTDETTSSNGDDTDDDREKRDDRDSGFSFGGDVR